MSRRRAAIKRNLLPDNKYQSVLVSRFINKVMNHGKKELAEKLFYKALQTIETKYKVDGFETFITACNNVKPQLEVESVRIGGANYQVPSPVSDLRAYHLACTWIINAASKRTFEKTMWKKLSEEIHDASNNKGGSVKKKEDTHKMAEANKAFAHFSTKRYKSH